MVSIAIVKLFCILIQVATIGVFDMRQITRILKAVRRPMPTGLRDDWYEPERPVSFVEIAAASALLDFGGIPDGRWSHAWQVRGSGDFQPAHETSVLRPRILQDVFENNTAEKALGGRKKRLPSARSGACCVRNS
jgi:hypothetical protein